MEVCMRISRFNKTTAAVVAGAATSVIGGFLAVDGDSLAAAQTLLTALLVWLVPNTD
jgi:riboflavin synthase alpha subunit